VYETFAQPGDDKDWLLKPLFKLTFAVFSTTKVDEKTRDTRVKVYTDLQRNFLESMVPFTAMALGLAILKPEGSANAVIAVQVFTVCRTVLNVLLVWFSVQPLRAFAFVPQTLSYIYLAYEIYSCK